MSEFYDKIARPEQRPPRRGGAWLYVALVLVILALAAAAFVAYPVFTVRPSFYQYVAALSDSTVDAYAGGPLQGEVEGQGVHISGENAHALYRALSSWTPTRKLLFPPGRTPDLALEYRDGARLQLWQDVDAAGQPAARGVSMRFDAADGRRFQIQFEGASFSILLRWASPDAQGNRPWNP